jgi:hypothetical protein
MIHPLRGGATALLAVVAGGVGLAVFGATAASALTSSGNVTIVDASNKAIVTAQDAAVLFTANVPAGAVCPGSGAQGYSVDSFLVPAGTDPSTISFTTGLPSNGLGYFDQTGNTYEGGFPASSTGGIIGLPVQQMNWAGGLTLGDFTIAQLTGGSSMTWDSGWACVFQGAVVSFFDQQITFRTSTTASGMTYTPIPQASTVVPQSPLAIALPVGGAAMLAVGVLVNRRRTVRRKDATTVAA